MIVNFFSKNLIVEIVTNTQNVQPTMRTTKRIHFIKSIIKTPASTKTLARNSNVFLTL